MKLVNKDPDGNGEICFWGRTVFMGYLNMEEKTREVFDEDGWLHSGDIGKMDTDGFLQCTIDPESMEPTDNLTQEAIRFCNDVGSKSTTVTEIVGQQDQAVYRAIQEGIDKVNSEAVSNAQRIQKWAVLPKDFSILGGEMGPTMKIKRHAILEKYKDVIETFYSG
ncbi:hypothetical protein AB205_0179010 [Aquarana catesbeiana]|uniref:Uncharacterized protein n=1 Tax=Aquarana catesbeiana TaxID=8400 RepID=A0A2G9RZS3_AQUCT|nr:hypothetical protein AB205_0179010 [Aquarana catesbeiana]